MILINPAKKNLAYCNISVRLHCIMHYGLMNIRFILLFFLLIPFLFVACSEKKTSFQTLSLKLIESSSIIVHSIDGVILFGDSRDGQGKNQSLLENIFNVNTGSSMTTWNSPIKIKYPIVVKWSYSETPEVIHTCEFHHIINEGLFQKMKGYCGSLVFLFYQNEWYLVWVAEQEQVNEPDTCRALYYAKKKSKRVGIISHQAASV